MKNRPFRYYSIIIAVMLLQACGSYQPYYGKGEQEWQQRELPQKEANYTVWLIGDAGKPSIEIQEPTFKALEQQLKQASSNSAIVFLGDNIYNKGMPPGEEMSERDKAEKRINESLDILKDFKGKPFFVPGNHDWYNGDGNMVNIRALEDEEEYIEDYLDRGKDVFLPNAGEPGPVEIQLSDKLVLVAFDSHRWIRDFKEDEAKQAFGVSKFDRMGELDAILDEHYDKHALIVCHHPLFTNGPHGGYFSYKDHLFPLTIISKKLMIPMPIIGSLLPLFRKFAGSIEDLPNLKYQNYKDATLEVLNKYEGIVFAAGHEHSLQYFNRQKNHHIVSGAGSKVNYTRKGHGAGFTHSHKGFVKLTYYQDNEVWMEYYEPIGDGARDTVVFRKQLNPTELDEVVSLENDPDTIMDDPPYVLPDTMLIDRASDLYEAKALKRTFKGDLYRDTWRTDTRFRIIDLSTEKGGLTPVKQGGGQQTRSLRLEAQDGKQYVLRSVEKYATKALPDYLQNTIAEKLIQDGLAASHPYGALSVPILADAVGVLHTDPEIVYLPDDPILGRYREKFRDALYVFEERPDDEYWNDYKSFGKPDEIEATTKVLDKITDEQDHVVDQQAVLRVRLFDIWLHDWDRHDDQWRWAEYDHKDSTVYKPIPRDRDQVYFKFDGITNRIASSRIVMRKFRTFDNTIHDMIGLTWNATYFDRTFLTQMEEKDFIAMAEELQMLLTDSIIESAFKVWPKEIYDNDAEQIISHLKARREQLVDFAKEWYLLLAKEVDILGTDDRELFLVERLNNEETKVTVHALSQKKGKVKHIIYQRTFKRSETREIRIYGFKDNDEFKLTGKVKKGIRVRIIGGKGKDTVIDESHVGGITRKTKVYDTKGNTTTQLNKESRNLTQRNNDVNTYDRFTFKYNKTLPAIALVYNPDDGLFIGGGVLHTKYGFRKEPYWMQHKITASVATSTGAFNFLFYGDYVGVIRKVGVTLDFELKAPNAFRNYFGLGNETEQLTESLNFHRVRAHQVIFKPAFKRAFGEQLLTFTIGPTYTLTDIEDDGTSSGRFITIDSITGLTDEAFKNNNYGGIEFTTTIDKVDNKQIPSRGIRLSGGAHWNANMDNIQQDYLQLKGEASIYYTFDYLPFDITLAARVGGAHNYGQFEFFQTNTLGGLSNLRGLRRDRFQGRTSLYQNTELRIKLAHIKNYLFPFSLGLIGLADHGRVWVDNDPSTETGSSDVWHHGYGGGIWFAPADLLAITLTYSVSDDDKIFNVGFGFLF